MKSLFKKLVLFKAIFKYLYNPKNVRSVIEMGNAISNSEKQKQSISRARQSTDMANLIDERFGLEDFDLNSLKNLDDGTLGREFYKYILDQNLDPQFYKFKLPKARLSDYSYLAGRLRKTHDLWHLATGFNTSEEDEAGLIAFYYAQLGSPLSGLIIGLSFVHFLLRKPNELPKLLDQITRGWRLGKSALPLASVRWENLWKVKLSQLKEELKLY